MKLPFYLRRIIESAFPQGTLRRQYYNRLAGIILSILTISWNDWWSQFILNIKRFWQYRFCHLPKGFRGNVLLVTHDLSISGAPLLLYNLAPGFKNQGYYVTIISPSKGGLSAKFDELDIPVIIDNRFFISQSSTNAHLMKKYDIIIANTLLNWRSVLSANKVNRAVIWLIHENQWGSGYIYHNPQAIEAFSVADQVVLASQKVADLYQKYKTHDNFKVIYYGIKTPEIRDVHLNRRGRVRFLSIAANITFAKGFDILIRSILEMDEDTRSQCEFVIVGQLLDDDFCKKLVDMVKAYPCIQFNEPVPHDRIFDFYNQSDIYVCPSRDEVLPLTVLEAMSQGNIILATEVGGLPEIIQNGVNGILFPSEDAATLTRIMTYLVNNPEKRIALSEGAVKSFKERFTVAKYSQKINDLMCELNPKIKK
jgi:O-antigen biosynthesis protein